MFDPAKYTVPLSSWSGLFRYANEHPELYKGLLPVSFSEDDLLKTMKKQAQDVLSPKEYDTFRKAFTSLRKGNATSVKRENLYRLFFVLRLGSDTEAQNLLMNYLHQSELSARSLDEFIIIAALKMNLSWEDTCDIRNKYAEVISKQPLSPGVIAEGQTAEVYYSVIHDKLHTKEDLCRYLDDPENTAFFSRTCNTQYLALFDDVQLEVLYNGTQEELVRMYINFGTLERETMLDYYYSLFGMSETAPGDGMSEAQDSPACPQYNGLTEDEITALAGLFENVFMSYDNFCLLVQRKRPVNVSSGTFLLGLFKKLYTEKEDAEEDFYVDFLNPEEFTEVINDILIYFGFPIINPELDPFERLVMDTYEHCLASYPDISNTEFQQVFIDCLRDNLKQLAAYCLKNQ